MLRYLLVFLLINIYGRSLGVPVKEISNSKILIGNLLGELSKNCKNKFVLDQIKSKYNTCNVELPPYHDDNLQCLLFYDANRLMCNLTESNADLAPDFTAKLSEKQSVSVFCSEAAHFNVPSAAYQKTITTVFQNDVACKKVCADEDILTGDINFFCKYYKLTLTLLKLNAQQSSTILKPTVNPDTSVASGLVEEKNDNSTQVNHPSDGQLKITSDPVALVTNAQSLQDETDQHPSALAIQVAPSVGQLPVVHNQESSNLHSIVDNTVKKGTQTGEQVQTAGGTGNEKPTNVDGQPIDGISNEASIDANIGAIRNADVVIQQIETPGEQRINVENDAGDDASMDMEGDDAKEGEAGDDGDDPIGSDMEVKIEPEAKNSAKQIDTQSQREFFQNPDGFTEDDDHFFPFFLTAVIVVAVLYILYHNKNKVSKMFFGLIVEGRQPGRRRNSRGHAYRRLNTLEQAMSANSAAPPSKIIY